jgi:hypothetical protein
MVSQTQYVQFNGKAYWTKLYKPDEFKGAVRWTMNLYMDDPEEWNKYKALGIQKKVNKDENGSFFAASRPTTKMIKGKIVYFTPPVIYGKDGKVLVGYYGEDDKMLRSYDDPKTKIVKKGETILIGNGSDVQITLCVYPTAMGPGNRLESVKLIDLIEYKEPVETEEENETVKW